MVKLETLSRCRVLESRLLSGLLDSGPEILPKCLPCSNSDSPTILAFVELASWDHGPNCDSKYHNLVTNVKQEENAIEDLTV